MKVYIGPFKGYYGVYDIAYFFEKFGVSEDKCQEIGEKLENSWFGKLVMWINDKVGSRKVKIRIDPYDTWSMDHTLAMIIVPMLKQLKTTNHGSPSVDDKDVPQHLRSTNDQSKREDWDIDKFHHDRWEYIMTEMIWAFEQIVEDEIHSFIVGGKFDKKAHDAHYKRLDNGTRLFGKYFRALWD